MSILLALFFVLLILLAAALMLFMLFRLLRTQARIRRSLDVVMLQVTLPKDLAPKEKEEGIGQDVKEKIAIGEQFLSTLAYLPITMWDRLLYGRPIIALEILARNDDVIVFCAGTERRFIDHLEKQIYAHYPDAEVISAGDYTLFEPHDVVHTGVVKLTRSGHLPIATYKELGVDPMQALTGALAKIQKKDSAVIQYIIQPAPQKARQKGRRAANKTFQGKQKDIAEKGTLAQAFGDSFAGGQRQEKREQELSHLTPRGEQRVELVEQKASGQLFSVTIRVAVSARSKEETDRILTSIGGAFVQYDLPDLNSLRLQLLKRPESFIRDLIFRIPSDKVNVIGAAELASLFHFPLPTTGTPNILWRGARVAPLPAGLPQSGVMLGHNVYRGISTPVYVAEADRRRHVYMVGQTGTGKTTLFLNMIVQDILAGRGVGVVDPHGDLIEDILPHIPLHRQKDVILFDPRDIERPIGFNMLQVKDSAQKDLVVNEVVQILQKLAARLNPESVGPMFEHYLRNALLALAEDANATLIDVPRMFVDASFRSTILAKVSNPTVLQFWQQEFAQSQRGQLSADMLSYVISKLGRFISNEVVRNIIGQAQSSFDIREVIDEGKILLCNLSKGILGDINSDLLGFLLVSKIQIAALGRANIPEEERKDFYLYLDEFQNFTTDSIAVILSEARKYKLNLNVTHQFIKQLPDNIREAVFGNIGTIVSYRVGVEDAPVLAKQFDPVFQEYDLVNLNRYTAAVRLLAHGSPQRAFSLHVSAPPTGGDIEGREAVRELSRQTYGRSRDVVRAEILQRFKVGAPLKSPETEMSQGDYMSESLFDVN